MVLFIKNSSTTVNIHLINVYLVCAVCRINKYMRLKSLHVKLISYICRSHVSHETNVYSVSVHSQREMRLKSQHENGNPLPYFRGEISKQKKDDRVETLSTNAVNSSKLLKFKIHSILVSMEKLYRVDKLLQLNSVKLAAFMNICF